MDSRSPGELATTESHLRVWGRSPSWWQHMGWFPACSQPLRVQQVTWPPEDIRKSKGKFTKTRIVTRNMLWLQFHLLIVAGSCHNAPFITDDCHKLLTKLTSGMCVLVRLGKFSHNQKWKGHHYACKNKREKQLLEQADCRQMRLFWFSLAISHDQEIILNSRVLPLNHQSPVVTKESEATKYTTLTEDSVKNMTICECLETTKDTHIWSFSHLYALQLMFTFNLLKHISGGITKTSTLNVLVLWSRWTDHVFRPLI